ncbi:MAG: Coenzyme F420 hydrogenase/dehydrogenase, beta subunit C-terminal domain [Eubacteriales bacterium]|nr:Coenzyme F420 hydrogenase/dehydrogenase, beta subunit C-terminal domain [Eubacteriales bacterium]
MTQYFQTPVVYAAKHREDSERLRSQSGGMFAVLSDSILDRGGVVYGCVFNDRFEAVHARTETREGRDRMRGSKYVQSSPGTVYLDAAKDLEDGRTVLFSGTSCQIAGLLAFLQYRNTPEDRMDRLYTVDIVCHGVPSPLVWRDYLAWEAGRKKKAVRDVICRNKKKFGWKTHVTTLTFADGKTLDSRVFPRLFYGHRILRPSCYQCPYKKTIHPADITIADYWGIEKALPEFWDNKGVSLVLINTARGEKLFETCADRAVCRKTRVEDSLQKPLIAPFDPPADRKQFWQTYRSADFTRIAKKYANYNPINTMKWKLQLFLKRGRL